MKILIASDSHHSTDKLLELYKAYPNMDLYLYAGDSEDFPSAIYPFDSVKGNCDYYEYDEKRFIRLPCGNLLMKHHPRYDQDEIKDVNIFVHGHTHIAKICKENKLIILCPGSISYSRDSTNGSFAIIECDENLISIKILSLENKKILFKLNNKVK